MSVNGSSSKGRARRVRLAGALAVGALAAASVFVEFGTPLPEAHNLAVCPQEESEDTFTSECVPDISPNVPGGNYPTPGHPTPGPQAIPTATHVPGSPHGVPEYDGVPCESTHGANGLCAGLERS